MTLVAFWTAALAHLVQTTVVLAALWLLARALRRAPARVEHTLWTLGLLKVAVPLSAGGALAGAWLPAPLAEPLVRGASWLAPVSAAGASAAPAWLVALTALWFTGAVLGLGYAAAGVAGAAALRRSARVPDAAEAVVLARALRGSAVPSGVIRLTGRRLGAVTAGLLRPVIVLDEELPRRLPAEELRAVLEHEDAHRRRRDPARALVRRLLAAVFFPFPLLVPLNRRLSETAEYACDEYTLRTVAPAVYARALSRVALRTLRTAPAPAFVGKPRESFLARRFRRLETFKRSSVMPMHRLVLTLAAAAVFAASFSPSATARDAAPGDAVSAAAATAKDAAPAEAPATDSAPVPLTMEPPFYPEPAKTMGAGGRVLLKVLVGEDGKPEKIEVVEGVEGYPELEGAASEAVKAWTFTPARKDGKAVAAEVILPVLFDLEGC